MFQAGSVYVVVAWGASLGAADLLPAFGIPDWGIRVFVVAAVAGLPLVLVLAWIYEVSAEGVLEEREAGASQSPVTTQLSSDTPIVLARWPRADGPAEEAFGTDFTIGRDPDCDVRIDDARVSRRHARVMLQKGIWHLEDLGSRNGTRVEGELVGSLALPQCARIDLCPGGPWVELELRRPGQSLEQQ